MNIEYVELFRSHAPRAWACRVVLKDRDAQYFYARTKRGAMLKAVRWMVAEHERIAWLAT